MFNGPNPTLNAGGNLYDRLFPMRGLAMAAAILFIIGTAGFLSIHFLKNRTRLVVNDTLVGLSDASLANASLVETFNKTLLMLTATNDVERGQYRADFETYDKQVSEAVTAYASSIFTDEDRANYSRLMQRRKEFLVIHQQIDEMVQAGKFADAQKLFKGSLFPSYREYKSSAEKVIKYNADEGKQRGEVMLQICVATQFAIAGAGIVLFLFGFFTGFFK